MKQPVFLLFLNLGSKNERFPILTEKDTKCWTLSLGVEVKTALFIKETYWHLSQGRGTIRPSCPQVLCYITKVKIWRGGNYFKMSAKCFVSVWSRNLYIRKWNYCVGAQFVSGAFELAMASGWLARFSTGRAGKTTTTAGLVAGPVRYLPSWTFTMVSWFGRVSSTSVNNPPSACTDVNFRKNI